MEKLMIRKSSKAGRSGARGCKKHPKHEQTPGVCSLCLREKLSRLSRSTTSRTTSATMGSTSSTSSLSSYYSSSCSSGSSCSSPVASYRFNDRNDNQKGVISWLLSGESNVKFGKSRSVVSFPRRVRGNKESGEEKKKSRFWSRLLRPRSKRRDNLETLVRSRTTVRDIRLHA